TVRPVGRKLAHTLAVDGQVDLAAAPAADLDLDPVRQPERHAETVVAGPEVGARRGHLDGHPAAVELGEPVRHHPRASATPPTVGSASITCRSAAIRSAVEGSFRPVPVRTQTTVSSAAITPLRAARAMPATPAADDGSQKIPS